MARLTVPEVAKQYKHQTCAGLCHLDASLAEYLYLLSQSVQVPLCCLHRPQSRDMVPRLRPRYIPYTFMDPSDFRSPMFGRRFSHPSPRAERNSSTQDSGSPVTYRHSGFLGRQKCTHLREQSPVTVIFLKARARFFGLCLNYSETFQCEWPLTCGDILPCPEGPRTRIS